MKIELSEQDVQDVLAALDIAVKAGGLKAATRLLPVAVRFIEAAKDAGGEPRSMPADGQA